MCILADITSFKDIILNMNSYNEMQNHMDELEQLGDASGKSKMIAFGEFAKFREFLI